MSPEVVASRVDAELQAFAYEPTSRDGLLGAAWSTERMAREVALLRAALVQPRVVRARNADWPPRPFEFDGWVVTAPDENGYVVLFDPERDSFGLAVTASDDVVETVNVWGDLVTTFSAR
jgi:hypothetical protein